MAYVKSLVTLLLVNLCMTMALTLLQVNYYIILFCAFTLGFLWPKVKTQDEIKGGTNEKI